MSGCNLHAFARHYLEINHSGHGVRAFHCRVEFCYVHPEVDLAGTLAFEFSFVLPCSPDIIAFDNSTTRSLHQQVRIEFLLDCCDRYDPNVHMCFSSVHETSCKHVPFQSHS